MKITEIVNRSKAAYLFGTPEQEAEALAWLDLNPQELSPAEGGRYSIWRKHTFYFVKAGDEIAGWANLEPAEVHGIKCYRVQFVYFRKQFRNTRAIVVLLHGAKQHLDKPLVVLPNDKIFMDGARLMLAVKERGMFKLSVLHTAGKKEPLSSLDQLELSDSILIEDVPPLWNPAKDLLGRPTGQKHIFEWFGSSNDVVI